MPELHKLIPTLTVIQEAGHAVALVTDGRLSGASGKVLAAIHVWPEAAAGGAIARLQDGDIVTVCAQSGELSVQSLADAVSAAPQSAESLGRNLFSLMRRNVTQAEAGACSLFEEAV
jgi:phosphogluconate dehydratase